MFLKKLIPKHWHKHLQHQISSGSFVQLSDHIALAYQTTTCFPKKEDIFKIFDCLKLEDVKIVIIGQDPYHGKGQAQGLSFSVPDNQKLPPSLLNIYKEIAANINLQMPYSGDLHYLVSQGVFLLNAILTVEENKPGSHQKKGWEIFTDQVIELISNHNKHVVFMLWGNYAIKKEKLIDNQKHLILKAGHPSPMSANQGKWFGNNHFNLANEYLEKNHLKKIEWFPKFNLLNI